MDDERWWWYRDDDGTYLVVRANGGAPLAKCENEASALKIVSDHNERIAEREAYCSVDVALIRSESVLSLIRYRGPNPPVPGPSHVKNATPDLTRNDLDAVLGIVVHARKKIQEVMA